MDRHSVDIFHHQERLSVAGDSAVKEPGDQRMVEPGENLPLHPEALAEQVSGQRKVDQLDCHLLFEIPISPMGHVDRAHAASTDQAVNFIGADAFSIQARSCFGTGLQKAGGSEQFLLLAGLEKRAHLGLERGIFSAP